MNEENKNLLNEEDNAIQSGVKEEVATEENSAVTEEVAVASETLNEEKKQNPVLKVLKTVGGWFVRTFKGASKSLADDKFNVEEIVSPTKQIVQSFFRRKGAVVALCVVVFMFLFVFIGPLCMPTYSDSYTASTQINMPPCYSMLSVNGAMKDQITSISGKSSFTVGVSKDGNLYIWGSTYLSTLKMDIGQIPEEVKNANIKFAAAGTDHIIAIDENGKVYAWGSNRLGQYVKDEADLAKQTADTSAVVVMPEILRTGNIDVENVKKVVCGTQASAILMKDGTLYIWGNLKTNSNMDRFTDPSLKFWDIDFTLTTVVGVTYDKTAVYTGQNGLFDKLKMDLFDTEVDQTSMLRGRKIETLATTTNNICVTLDDHAVLFAGAFASEFNVAKPNIGGKKENWFVSIAGGSGHYVGITNKGKAYAWGDNTHGQCNLSTQSGATQAFAGSYQSYVADENGKLMEADGLKGYLFGTDEMGADIFKRLISGGKMTLTIGAVAVIISTIIGIIIGCLSGYFGGKVDMILMRVTEIVSAIPFLPFAMILSALLSQTDIAETTKIFMIMVILGLLSWTGLARLVRGQVLAARENEYVTAAKAMGVKEVIIAFKHILPNVISVIIVTLTLDFAGCMLTESSLSYLGFGVQYPRPTWGNMLNSTTNLTVIGNFWWRWLFPGIFLAVTTICINIIGDTLRDVMDPKSTNEK